MTDVPSVTPVTRPVLEIVATAVVADILGVVVAAVTDPVNWEVNPPQTVSVPAIAGRALTVTVAILVQPLLLV